MYIPKGVNLSTWKYEGHSTSQVSPRNYHFICILCQFSFWTNLLKHWYLAFYWNSNKRFTLKDKDSNKIPRSKSFGHFNPKYSPALQTWILESANLESNSQTRAKKSQHEKWGWISLAVLRKVKCVFARKGNLFAINLFFTWCIYGQPHCPTVKSFLSTRYDHCKLLHKWDIPF